VDLFPDGLPARPPPVHTTLDDEALEDKSEENIVPQAGKTSPK